MEISDFGIWLFFYCMGALVVTIIPIPYYFSIIGVGIFALIGFFVWFMNLRNSKDVGK